MSSALPRPMTVEMLAMVSNWLSFHAEDPRERML
jgi:hypothetical protein